VSKSPLRVLVCAALLFLLSPLGAAARPGYGENVDAFCSAQGRGAPFADLAGQGFLSECSLCHAFVFPPDVPGGGNTFNPPAREYKNGNYAYFCPAVIANGLPVITPIADRNVIAGQMVVIDVVASDPDADPLVLTASNAPATASFVDHGNGTGTFTWTPAAGDLGTRTVTFLAHDDATPPGQAMEPVAITVGSANRPPVLGAIGNRMGEAGVPLLIDVSATDLDGDALTLSALTLPSGAVFTDHRDGTGRFEWTPGTLQLGNHAVTFRVTDAGVPSARDEEAVTLTIGAAVNAPPVLGAIGNRTVRAGLLLHVPISATDMDGDSLAFTASGLPAGASLTDNRNGTAALDWSPLAGDVGTHPVTVLVSDDGTPPESDSERFDLFVQAEPPPPGDVRIDAARWIPEDAGGALEVQGSGANAGEMVAILDADSATVLGSRRARRGGTFRLETHPAVPPCAVMAQTADVRSEPLGVTGVPADCAMMLMTQVRAKWECAESEEDEVHEASLRVRGGPAPAGASIAVSDASSGAVLGSAEVDPRGRFRLDAPIATAPNAIEVLVTSDGQQWTLGPIPVSVDCDDLETDDAVRPERSYQRRGSRERD
jgi:Bacterial Ig domain/Putative Ig domain